MCDEKHLQKLSDKAYRYAILVVKNREDALDVMQETLYRYIVKKPEFENERAEIKWIYKVASNLSRNVILNSWYKKKTDIPDNEWEKLLTDNDSDFGIEGSIYKAVRSLPKKYSDVIYLYYYEGYHASEICAILGIRNGTFYSRLTRARSLLKRKLKPENTEIFSDL